MGRFLIIVLDGFGVGEMPDVSIVRPQDIGANTAESILKSKPDLYLPNLESLGLMNVLGHESERMHFSQKAIFGKAKLMHKGGDTFFGHQEIAGTRPSEHIESSIAIAFDQIEEILKANGFQTEVYHGSEGRRLLIVNKCVTVADNIECDPGQAYNVTAAIDDIPFEKVVEIGKLVRSVSKVPRVIAFGGRGVHIRDILDAIEEHDNGYIGVNAPKSGVYREDYHCVHLGYGVDPTVQIPSILGKAGIPVYLLGKAADVVRNPYGTSYSIVNTDEVLGKTLDILREKEDAFIFANVQETDLAGHREDPFVYADVLQHADTGIGKIIKELKTEDIMVVTADHGNDPLIGHPHHTREMVPLMIWCHHGKPGFIGVQDTLSDVGASASDYFNMPFPENGTSFLKKL